MFKSEVKPPKQKEQNKLTNEDIQKFSVCTLACNTYIYQATSFLIYNLFDNTNSVYFHPHQYITILSHN